MRMEPYIKPGELEIENPENTVREIYRNMMLDSYFRNLGMNKKTIAGGAVLGVALAALILSSGCTGAVDANRSEKTVQVYDFSNPPHNNTESYVLRKCEDSVVMYVDDRDSSTIGPLRGMVMDIRPEIVEKYCGPLQNHTINKTK